MISGSSSIQNIHQNNSKQVIIRATLSGSRTVIQPQPLNGFQSYVYQPNNINAEVAGGLATTFNNKYVVYTNYPGTSQQHIYSYDAGGSLINKTSLTANQYAFLYRGDFQNLGNTLNLVFVSYDNPTQGISYSSYITRLSSSNGISFGSTVLLMQDRYDIGSGNPRTNFDISLVGASEAYVIGLDDGVTFTSPQAVKYFAFGSSAITAKTLTEFEETSDDKSKIIAMKDLDTTRIVIEGEGDEFVGTLYNSPYKKSLYTGLFTKNQGFGLEKIVSSGTSTDLYMLIKSSGNTNFIKFGIERIAFQYGIQDGAVYTVDEKHQTIDVSMDMEGNFSQRIFYTGLSQTMGFINGGVSYGSSIYGGYLFRTGISTLSIVNILGEGANGVSILSDIVDMSINNSRSLSLSIGNNK